MSKISAFSFFLILLFGCNKKDDDFSFFREWKLDAYIINKDSIVTNYDETYLLKIKSDSSCTLTNPHGICTGNVSKNGKEINFTIGNCTDTCCSNYLVDVTLEILNDSITKYEENNVNIKLKGEHGSIISLSPQ